MHCNKSSSVDILTSIKLLLLNKAVKSNYRQADRSKRNNLKEVKVNDTTP